MIDIVFVSDYFLSDINGGSEQTFEELFSFLEKEKYSIKKVHCRLVTLSLLQENKESLFLINNFVYLKSDCKLELKTGGYKYIIYENDWKCFRSRNPLTYLNCIAPENEIINFDFYKNAKVVLCQSKIHSEIIQKNLFLDNIVNLGCNFWNDNILLAIQKRLDEKTNNLRKYKYSIMNSKNLIKGTKQAIDYCKKENIEFHLIPELNQEDFYNELSNTEILIFFPQTFETYSRVFIEARMLGCKIITNKAIGVLSEDYSRQIGSKLLDTIRIKKLEVLNKIKKLIEQINIVVSEEDLIPSIKWPLVSLISVVYKGEEFINGMVESFLSQTYKNKELIIVDCSPDNLGYLKIKDFIDKFYNIVFLKIPERITPMRAFNIAEQTACGEFIAICLVDDRLASDHLETSARTLLNHLDVDLVYRRFVCDQEPK